MNTNQLSSWSSFEHSNGVDTIEFIAFTRTRNQKFIGRLVVVLALLVIIVACEPTTPEPIDTGHISGRWELMTGDETEWFDISSDGGFSATIRSNGFIATTLSQGETITLDGRWQLAENALTFHIENSSDEVLIGQGHRYEVKSLTNRSMVTVDASGRQQTLIKAL